MFKTSTIPFKKLGILSCVVLGMCFWTEEAFAQGEQEKSGIENIRNMDKAISGDQSSNLEYPNKASVQKTTQPNTNNSPVKKEVLTSGEGKKNEPSAAPSTLSFNIFLYIVDKFKAD